MSRTLNNLASGVVYDIIDRAIKRGNVRDTLEKIGTHPYSMEDTEGEVENLKKLNK